MNSGYYNGIAGLRVAQLAQEAVANNLANAQTVGFKAARPFVEALEQALATAPGAAPRVGGIGVDFTPGPLRPTGQPLDVAFEGKAMLAVETPGGERYTRDGRLAVDAPSGALVTLSGYRVLGDSGPIVVGIEPAEVREDGTVLAGGIEVGRLRLVDAGDGGTLRPEGAGLFASVAPLPPAAEARVQPGFVESSNVDPVRSAVTLIETLRSFEAIQRANQLLLGDMARSLFEEAGRTLR